MANIEGQNWHREIGTPLESQAKYSDRSDFYSKRVNLKLGQSFDSVISDLVGSGYETFEGHKGKNMERQIKGGDQLFKILRAYYKDQYEMDPTKAEKEAYLTLAYVMKTGGVPTNVDLLQIGGKIKIEDGRLSIWHEGGNLAMDAIAMRPPTGASTETDEEDEDLPDKGEVEDKDEAEERRGGGGGTRDAEKDDKGDEDDAGDEEDKDELEDKGISIEDDEDDADKGKKAAKRRGGTSKKKEASDEEDKDELEDRGISLDEDEDEDSTDKGKKAAKKREGTRKAKEAGDEEDEGDADDKDELDDRGVTIEDDELDGDDYELPEDPGLDLTNPAEAATMKKWMEVDEGLREKLEWDLNEAVSSGLLTPVDGGYEPISGFTWLGEPTGNYKVIPVIESKYALPNIKDRNFEGAARRGHLWDMDAHEDYPLFMDDQFETFLSGFIEGDKAQVDVGEFEGEHGEISVLSTTFLSSGAEFLVKKDWNDHSEAKISLGELEWTIKSDSPEDEAVIVKKLANKVTRLNARYLDAKKVVEEHWDSDDADEYFYMEDGEIYVNTGNFYPNYSVYNGSGALNVLQMIKLQGAPIKEAGTDVVTQIPSIEKPDYHGDREIVEEKVDTMVSKYAEMYGVEDLAAFKAFLMSTGHLTSEFAFGNGLIVTAETPAGILPPKDTEKAEFNESMGNDGSSVYGENWIQQEDVAAVSDFQDLGQNLEHFITGFAGPAFKALKEKHGDDYDDSQLFEHIAFNWEAGVVTPYFEYEYDAKMEEYDATMEAAQKEIDAGRNVGVNRSMLYAAKAQKEALVLNQQDGMAYLDNYKEYYARYRTIENAQIVRGIDLVIDEDMKVTEVSIGSRVRSIAEMEADGHERVYATLNDPGSEKVMIGGEEYKVVVWHEMVPDEEDEVVPPEPTPAPSDVDEPTDDHDEDEVVDDEYDVPPEPEPGDEDEIDADADADLDEDEAVDEDDVPADDLEEDEADVVPEMSEEEMKLAEVQQAVTEWAALNRPDGAPIVFIEGQNYKNFSGTQIKLFLNRIVKKAQEAEPKVKQVPIAIAPSTDAYPDAQYEGRTVIHLDYGQSEREKEKLIAVAGELE